MPISTRVLLKFLERLSFDEHGNAFAWYPARELAEELGLTERQIAKAVETLRNHKALAVKSAGHRGRATTYYVMPGIPWPKAAPPMGSYKAQTAERSPSEGPIAPPPTGTPKTYRGGRADARPHPVEEEPATPGFDADAELARKLREMGEGEQHG